MTAQTSHEDRTRMATEMEVWSESRTNPTQVLLPFFPIPNKAADNT